MTYDQKDIDFVRVLMDNVGDSCFYPTKVIVESLRQTEVFHYLFTQKLLSVIDGEKFDLDLTGIEKKLDVILGELKKFGRN